jgi:hypothetical protein
MVLQRVLEPVLVSFDDHQSIAFRVERLDDGRAVLYLPGRAQGNCPGGCVAQAPRAAAMRRPRS